MGGPQAVERLEVCERVWRLFGPVVGMIAEWRPVAVLVRAAAGQEGRVGCLCSAVGERSQAAVAAAPAQPLEIRKVARIHPSLEQQWIGCVEADGHDRCFIAMSPSS